MHLVLINPRNPMVTITRTKGDTYRVWKPLSLMSVAALTPADWEVEIIDENILDPNYENMPPPDLVGITAFTSQATRAYTIADQFRESGVPVVMGGIHATMCMDEALEHVDSVVCGEAEGVWQKVLGDFESGQLDRVYDGGLAEIDMVPPARHDLLDSGYRFGAIQTTRGCPLKCSFCSVTAFNGGAFRLRPVEDVVRELSLIREKYVLFVDDNLCGTRAEHILRTKRLFRAIIEANLGKKWICQVTINMADDDELLSLASKAGCIGAYIGFEATSDDGLDEVHKKFNMQKNRNFPASVRRMQKRGIVVVGSFVLGLDADRKGVGEKIAKTAEHYGVDILNLLFYTPLPGTKLWDTMEQSGRIKANNFPDDWQYYTLTFPVAEYLNFSWKDMVSENDECHQHFYAWPRIVRRFVRNLFRDAKPFHAFAVLAANVSKRGNEVVYRKQCKELESRHHA